jgi:hypothetical protein
LRTYSKDINLSQILGSMRGSALIKHALIDHYVPFLPLEIGFVELCVKDYIKEKNYTNMTTKQLNCVLSHISVKL